jgi:hypothetical protein
MEVARPLCSCGAPVDVTKQIKLLTRRLDLLQIRYNKAKRDDMKSFRYTQRLQR